MPLSRVEIAGARVRRSVVALALCLFALSACSDDGATLLNCCPQIAHAGPAWWVDGELHVGIWIRDLEKDPVDLVVALPGGEEVENVYGHGRVGLSSGEELPGIPHELVFESGDLHQADEIVFTPEDVEGCQGEPVSLAVPAVGDAAGQ